MKYKEYLPNSEEYHLVHYLILLMGLIIFLLCFSFFKFLPFYQMVIAFLGCSFYITWGVLHHLLEGRLKREVVLEYFLFGLLAYLILTVLIIL